MTKKIIRGLVRIKYGYDKKLYLGNLDAKRDWSCERLCRSNVENFTTKKTR